MSVIYKPTDLEIQIEDSSNWIKLISDSLVTVIDSHCKITFQNKKGEILVSEKENRSAFELFKDVED